MSLQVLVAAMGQNVHSLAEQMNLKSNAIIINQDDYFGYEEFTHGEAKIKAYTFAERGVGLSRNNALLRADSDIVLFSDEDIVLNSSYPEMIAKEFKLFPHADIILFNVFVDERRSTYRNLEHKRVRWFNYGRYPAYSIAARVKSLHEANITFSLLFGGGAKYSNGEDSLFLRDCLKKGLKIYGSPVNIGREIYRESTWFQGYNEKFFYDRGVLYHFLYGRMAKLLALRFLLAKKGEICQEIKLKQAYRLMKSGIEQKLEFEEGRI
ncbi:MAG: glycosyltransferase family 2 protein [Lachnospiraceae bacterium]|nr:glycosyltransferase family 2 protein [Lachnospiraceae bacterium]